MPGASGRLASLDQMRGLAVTLMVVVNFLAVYSCTPAALRHAPPLGGLAFADVGAPFFYFMIGVGYRLSYLRRVARHGLARARWHIAQRYLILLAFGSLGAPVSGEHVIFGWNVLQAIGLAGLVALPFIGLAALPRAGAALALLGAWQAAGLCGYYDWLLPHDTGALGGVLGCLAWAALVLLASLVGDAVVEARGRAGEDAGGRADRRAERRYLGRLLTFAAAGVSGGLLLTLALPISKPLVTAPYILVCAGLAAAALVICTLYADRWRFEVPLMTAAGRNALLVFILAGLLGLVANGLVPPEAAPLAVSLAGAAVLAPLLLMAWAFHRRGVYWIL